MALNTFEHASIVFTHARITQLSFKFLEFMLSSNDLIIVRSYIQFQTTQKTSEQQKITQI